MKKHIKFILVLAIVGALNGLAQTTHLNAQNMEFAYTVEDNLYVSDSGGKTRFMGKGGLIKEDKMASTNKVVYVAEGVSPALIIPEGRMFYQGVQSPYEKKWVYLERSIFGNDFHLWEYHPNTAEQNLIFDQQTCPISEYALAPIAWSADREMIYLEALQFDGSYEHEGVWAYYLSTGKIQKLDITPAYMSTPVISPDRQFLIYTAASAEIKNRVHGIPDRIFAFDLRSNQEWLVTETKRQMHYIWGWTDALIQPDDVSNVDSALDVSARLAAQLNFKLPWQNGISYCVSRHGTPAPTGYPGNSSCSTQYSYSPHGYVAVDFDTPNGADHNIMAVAAGTVTAVSYDANGYGNYVIVTHSDNTQTLYAHLKTVYVSQGACVGQGTILGLEGTTGSSSGDHLHFEYRVGGSKQYAIFDECNCMARQNYNYTSSNVPSSCGNCPATLNFTAPINAGTYDYEASNYITAANTVGGTANVTYDGQNYVQLNPGFFAQIGCVFLAAPDGCGGAFVVNPDDNDRQAGEVEASVERLAPGEKFTLQPNPATDMLTIIAPLTGDAEVSIFDLSGRQMFYGQFREGETMELDVSGFIAGVYLVVLQGADVVHKKKLVVHR